jgi:Bardet-Biedl syndrome 1 protein
LEAWADPLAGIRARTRHIVLADVDSNGEYALVVADFSRRLRIFRNTGQFSEVPLLEIPTALVSYYMDLHPGSKPALVVAAGSSLYIYRGLTPSLKFTLPLVDVEPAEQQLWDQMAPAESDELRARMAGAPAGTPLQQPTVVTALAVLRKSMEDETAVGCLVVGTEARQLLILDPSAAKVLRKVRLRAAPALIATSGLYDVEYRVVAACRDGRVYTMRGGEVLAAVIELEAPPVGLVVANSMIHVAQMDGALHAFHYRGKKSFSLYLPSPAVDMVPLVSKSRAVNALLVAMANHEGMSCARE